MQKIENLGVGSEELKRLLQQAGLTEVLYDSGDFVDFDIDTMDAQGPEGILDLFMTA